MGLLAKLWLVTLEACSAVMAILELEMELEDDHWVPKTLEMELKDDHWVPRTLKMELEDDHRVLRTMKIDMSCISELTAK